MHTNIPEKLVKIVAEIDTSGQANTTRLTVLKKWFQQPERLKAFALWVVARAVSRKGKSAGVEGELFRQAKALLAGLDRRSTAIDRKAAEALHQKLKDFQNEHQRVKWSSVRVIQSWNLFLIEQALEICLWFDGSPERGYTLAADYCKHYDPKYGEGLNGPSRAKLLEMIKFMFTTEALEDKP